MQVVAQLSVHDLPDDVRGLSPRPGKALSEPSVLVLGAGLEAFSPFAGKASVPPSGQWRAPPAGVWSRGSRSGRGTR